MRYVVVGVVLVGVAVVGCSAGDDQGEGVPSSTIAAQVPAGFDPCKDIPKSVLDSEGLRVPPLGNNADFDGGGGIKWRGCSWVVPDGYAVGITTTNLTLDRIRANTELAIRHDYSIAGRPTLATSRADETDPRSVCRLNVAMNNGSLEFSLDNPASRRLTGTKDTCELARGLAEKVVALVPAGA
ncbi:DUF3558 domain-containing protein [Nocardia camponoti]|uniref:DUF3558 domain-containing protein n=1 Tax=Nocardia camponoti TaxID=1616106 RepID=A0A917QIL6_9NOCA|nr:DUF3558 domain-containing protein [Nocardia camponoti]GGK50789.1 hypothetical protein GCM10011591_22950 [Nocardia camponoti]